MTGAALLARVRSLGIDLVVLAPDRLRLLCKPEQLPAGLRAELAEHKADVLAALEAERMARFPRDPCDDCGRIDWVVTVVSSDGARHCPRCLGTRDGRGDGDGRGGGGRRRASAR